MSFNETEILDFFNRSDAILDSVSGRNTPEPTMTVPTWFTIAPPIASPSPTPTTTPVPTSKTTTTPAPTTAASDGEDIFDAAFDKALEVAKKNALAYSSSSDLSALAIIGIVIGCVVFVALTSIFVVRLRRKKANVAVPEPYQVNFNIAMSPAVAKKSSDDNQRSPSSRATTAGGSRATTMTLTNSSSTATPSDSRSGANHRAAAADSSYTSKSDASSSNLAGSALNGSSGSTGANTALWEDEAIVTARISKDKVITTSLISRGGYGEVYAGVYNGQPVAIKTLLAETKKNLKQINAFLSEVKLMASLDHERIVTFIGVAWDSLTDLCVVCELMDGGDLRGLLTRYSNQQHPRGFDADKIKIALHVAHALTYLHSLQPLVLHRDLKSKNILLDRELNAKLTDFGVSRERGDATMTSNVGTSLWMAPEVMVGERYDQKADMFSFGIVLSELDSHALPYAETRETPSGHRIPDAAVLQMVAMGRMHVQWSDEAMPEVVELGRACLALDATARPTASEALYRLHVLLRERSGAVSGFV